MHALPHKRAGVPPAGRLKPRSQSCTTRAQTQLGMHHYVQAYRITHNYCGHHRSPEIFRCVKPPKQKSSSQQLAQRCSNMLQLATSPGAAQASKQARGAHAHTYPFSEVERGTAQRDRKGQGGDRNILPHALRFG